MPSPPWCFLLANKTPHCISLGFASSLTVHRHCIGVQGGEQGRVDRLQRRCFLPELTEHRVSTDTQHPRGITTPTSIEAHVNDRVLHLRHTPAVAVVEQKTPCDAGGVLAQVALCTATCFAAFDDRLPETVGTLDRDERHGLLLAVGRYQDEVQCDSNLSPSPLLEHYQHSIVS